MGGVYSAGGIATRWSNLGILLRHTVIDSSDIESAYDVNLHAELPNMARGRAPNIDYADRSSGGVIRYKAIRHRESLVGRKGKGMEKNRMAVSGVEITRTALPIQNKLRRIPIVSKHRMPQILRSNSQLRKETVSPNC